MTGHIEQSPSTSPPSDGNVSTVPETSEANVHILQTSDNTSSNQLHLLQHLQILNGSRVNPNSLPDSDYTLLVPMPPAAIPVQVSSLNGSHTDESSDCDQTSNEGSLGHVKNTKLDGFDGFDQETTLDMDTHMTQHGKSRSKFLVENADGISTSRLSATSVTIKEEPTSEGEQQVLSGDDTNDSSNGHMMEMTTVLCKTSFNSQSIANNPKTWTQQDMENALEALRSHNMSLTKASATYGIPSTTLWQRAHRLGIDTPKKEGPSKSWSETNLHNALQALRTGSISANKASKAYGIPSSTLYKIARREGIRLAAPFNAAPTTWRPNDLERALDSIRSGHSSVQRASTEFGIPTGTLYGRCKREGIELSRSNPTPWSEDAMGEALEAVRVGQMSINQAAIHYNLPYSSLYGRFKRCKFEVEVPPMESQPTVQPVHHQMSSVVQHHHMPAQQTQIIQQMQHQVPHHGQSMIAHNPADANIPHAHHADMSSTHVYSVYHHPITSPASQPSTTHRPDNGMLGPGRDCIPTS